MGALLRSFRVLKKSTLPSILLGYGNQIHSCLRKTTFLFQQVNTLYWVKRSNKLKKAPMTGPMTLAAHMPKLGARNSKRWKVETPGECLNYLIFWCPPTSYHKTIRRTCTYLILTVRRMQSRYCNVATAYLLSITWSLELLLRDTVYI